MPLIQNLRRAPLQRVVIFSNERLYKNYNKGNLP